MHTTVFAENGVFAGWPANHGAWQWGDELLVGFMTGEYRPYGGIHDIVHPYSKRTARSMDGGHTWTTSVHRWFNWRQPMPSAPFDLANQIIRVGGHYDTGGEDCPQSGGYWRSPNKGETWIGPYTFDGLEEHCTGKVQMTGRTCVMPNGLIFLSSALRDSWGTDYVFCARHDGARFHFVSNVVKERNRAVMPAAATAGDRIVVAVRRSRQVDSVYSDDGGATWSGPRKVGETGSHNGNPPALVEVGGMLYCAAANRSTCEIWLSCSEDGGETWRDHSIIRSGDRTDIGYPRLFSVSGGALVCVYYWAEGDDMAARIEATRINL